MITTYCKDCNTEFRHAEKATQQQNYMYSIKKDIFVCKCGKVIEELRNPSGFNYK